MKKRLLAIWLAGLPCLVHAQSSITLFGTTGGGIRWENGVKGGSRVMFDNNIVSGSNFGLKGREDLGGGVGAIFAIAGSFTQGTGALASSGKLFSQAAYVGLSSNRFGRLTLGRQFNASEDLAILLDPAGGLGGLTTEPPVLLLGNYFTLDSRFDNTIKYIGEAGGFRLAASYSPGGVAGSTRAGTNFSIAGMYQYRGASIGATYEKTYSPDGSANAQTLLAGGSAQLGPVRIYLSNVLFRATATARQPGGATRRDNVQLVGFTWQAAPAIQLSGAFYYDAGRNLGNAPGADGHKMTSWLIAEYFLSKRTELYAEVDRNGFAGAYKKDPANIGALNLRPGGSGVTGVSIGMITRF